MQQIPIIEQNVNAVFWLFQFGSQSSLYGQQYVYSCSIILLVPVPHLLL